MTAGRGSEIKFGGDEIIPIEPLFPNEREQALNLLQITADTVAIARGEEIIPLDKILTEDKKSIIESEVFGTAKNGKITEKFKLPIIKTVTEALSGGTEKFKLPTIKTVTEALLSGGYLVLLKRYGTNEIKQLLKTDTLILGGIQSTLSLITPFLVDFLNITIIDPVLIESILVGLNFMFIQWLMGKKINILDFVESGGSHLASNITLRIF